MTAGLGYWELKEHYDNLRDKEARLESVAEWLEDNNLDPPSIPEKRWLLDSNCGTDLQLSWVKCVCGEKFNLTYIRGRKVHIDFPTTRKHVEQDELHFIIENGYECFNTRIEVKEEFSTSNKNKRGRQ